MLTAVACMLSQKRSCSTSFRRNPKLPPSFSIDTVGRWIVVTSWGLYRLLSNAEGNRYEPRVISLISLKGYGDGGLGGNRFGVCQHGQMEVPFCVFAINSGLNTYMCVDYISHGIR
jgi:hypothetical protein